MAHYKVRVNDTPGTIAMKLTGRPERMAELVAANPQKKPIAVDGRRTFAAMHVGENLRVPASWTRSLQGLGRGPTALGAMLGATAADLTADVAAILADTTICQGTNQNVLTFQQDYNSTSPTAALDAAGHTTLAEDGLYGPMTAAAAATVTASAPAACPPFGAASTTTLTPATISISDAYTALVSDSSICGGTANQNVINFQQAYNTWAGSALLVLDGIFGPATTQALNTVSQTAGYGVFACANGALQYTPPASQPSQVTPPATPTIPVTPPVTPIMPINPIGPSGGTSTTTTIVITGVAIAAAVGAYWLLRKEEIGHASGGTSKTAAITHRLTRGRHGRVAARRRR